MVLVEHIEGDIGHRGTVASPNVSSLGRHTLAVVAQHPPGEVIDVVDIYEMVDHLAAWACCGEEATLNGLLRLSSEGGGQFFAVGRNEWTNQEPPTLRHHHGNELGDRGEPPGGHTGQPSVANRGAPLTAVCKPSRTMAHVQQDAEPQFRCLRSR